jgi:hypothetical protein
MDEWDSATAAVSIDDLGKLGCVICFQHLLVPCDAKYTVTAISIMMQICLVDSIEHNEGEESSNISSEIVACKCGVFFIFLTDSSYVLMIHSSLLKFACYCSGSLFSAIMKMLLCFQLFFCFECITYKLQCHYCGQMHTWNN